MQKNWSYFLRCVYNSFIVWLKLNPENKVYHLTYRRNIFAEISFHSHDEKLRLIEKHFIHLYPQTGKKKGTPNQVLFAMSMAGEQTPGNGVRNVELGCL